MYLRHFSLCLLFLIATLVPVVAHSQIANGPLFGPQQTQEPATPCPSQQIQQPTYDPNYAAEEPAESAQNTEDPQELNDPVQPFDVESELEKHGVFEGKTIADLLDIYNGQAGEKTPAVNEIFDSEDGENDGEWRWGAFTVPNLNNTDSDSVKSQREFEDTQAEEESSGTETSYQSTGEPNANMYQSPNTGQQKNSDELGLPDHSTSEHGVRKEHGPSQAVIGSVQYYGRDEADLLRLVTGHPL